MSRGTVSIALLLLSAFYVSAIRQPLTVLEPAGPTVVAPQAVVEWQLWSRCHLTMQ
jgi:hypothetical protein